MWDRALSPGRLQVAIEDNLDAAKRVLRQEIKLNFVILNMFSVPISSNLPVVRLSDSAFCSDGSSLRRWTREG